MCDAARLLGGADNPVALKADAFKRVEHRVGAPTSNKSRASLAHK
jgi:hypothetical protein